MGSNTTGSSNLEDPAAPGTRNATSLIVPCYPLRCMVPHCQPLFIRTATFHSILARFDLWWIPNRKGDSDAIQKVLVVRGCNGAFCRFGSGRSHPAGSAAGAGQYQNQPGRRQQRRDNGGSAEDESR